MWLLRGSGGDEWRPRSRAVTCASSLRLLRRVAVRGIMGFFGAGG